LPDIAFDADKRARFPTKYHGEVSLSEGKWWDICARPERYYYRLNGDKIGTTLVHPDLVRHHEKEPNQFIYYKAFQKFQIVEGVEAPSLLKLMAVVIDVATEKICTVYPTDKPKAGKEYKT
jgi:hypothetical protein